MSDNPFLRDLPKPKKTAGKWFMDILQGIVIALAILVVMYLFIFIPNQVDGESMMPNFRDRELLLTNRIVQMIGNQDFMKSLNYDYKRGDVVIFQLPAHPDFIKRVIGLPGDRIRIQAEKVYVNDKLIDETYLPIGRPTKTYSFISEGETKVVPEGHYFLMGDNRNNSKDSRFIDVGFVPRKYIKGRVFFRYWPFNVAGFIGTGEIKYSN